MLEELTISCLGVIEAADLEFGPGLNVITGETGAGKTMVVTALGLLLGDRSSSAAVRPGATRARVEGRFSVEAGSAVAARAAELDAELDAEVGDAALLLARSVSAEGRSRATAGGAAVPVGVLAELAAELMVVHGQAGRQRLLSPALQRAALDAFGGDPLGAAKSAYQETFDRLAAVTAELELLTTQSRERAREADLLRYGLAEVASVAPEPGEDDRLAAEESRLGHVDGLRQAAEEAHRQLSGPADSELLDAATLAAGAAKSLQAQRGHDARLAELADRAAAATYALTDLATELASYAAALDADPVRLAAVSERRAALSSLTRKYGDTIDEVLGWATDAERRLAELDGGDARVSLLTAQRSELQAALGERGAALSELRADAARRLAAAVTAELHDLAMPDAVLSVALDPLDHPGREGLESVTLLLVPHPGAPPAPVHRAASGGELSRIMLALEVCLAGAAPPPLMVFDEVDAGVGGETAVEVGRRLARLATATQVVVVTHLAQVAAFADRHHVVVKGTDGSVTSSCVTALDPAGRRRELARMLAGLAGSGSALAHADELVAMAGSGAAAPRGAARRR